VWAFSNRQDWDEGLDPETRAEVHDKLTRFMRGRWFEPPFGGEIFTRLLLGAFDAMAALPAGPRLLPDVQPLDLFVTVTDFNGHPEILRLNSPPEIVETEHRLTFAFRDAPGEPGTIGDVPDLVFAARATASFPGAFPPFGVAELDRVLAADGRDWPGRDAFLGRVLPGHAEDAVLIDGSVLANAPFRPAIDALKNRPARREVDRRFVYIDPKPGIRSVKVNRGGDAELPGFFTTVFGALSDIPREQPIRDNLEAIEGRSARIRRMRRIIEALRPEVEASVAKLFGRTFFLDRPTSSRIAAWRARAVERAARDAGHSYSAYRQLRLTAIGKAASGASWKDAMRDPDAFLAARDLNYRIRRLRFVARRLATIAEGDPAARLDGVRDAVYRQLARFLELEVHPDPAADLPALDAETDAAIAAALDACDRPDRRAPLLAYVGFPFYDVATLALLQGEGFDEFDAIKIDRISPEEAQSIRGGGAAATLKGIQFNSFGAFFSRAYRENDYLWGRLHGAERLIDILVSTLPAPAALAPGVVAAAKTAVFEAILAEEAPRLSQSAALIARIREEMASAAGKAGASGLD
ncbi:MAG: patatin-like protein, partial [Sphingomonadaceae bacterium]|nr:patatin-like protein [Sphingomonadaceae bacterium]